MTQAGLSENIIITNINTSPGAYNTSVDGLIALQEAGVSEKVIAAIQAKAAAPASKTGGTFPPYEPPATRPPASEARNSHNDDVTQTLRAGMKVMVGYNVLHIDSKDTSTANIFYGPSGGIWIKNRVGIKLGMLTQSETHGGYDSYYDYGWSSTTRSYVIPVSGLFTVANINAGGLHIRPYVGGGVNFAFGDVAGGYYYGNYTVGGQVIFGTQLTVKAVRRLSFGPEVGYYRAINSDLILAGVNVNFKIF